MKFFWTRVLLGCFAAGVCFYSFAEGREASPLQGVILQARAKRLWEEKQWIKLVHYRSTLWGGYKSEMPDIGEGDPFFFAPDGRSNPQAELEATLTAFFSREEHVYQEHPLGDPANRDRQHPVCQFPARFMFLSKALNLNPADLPFHDCGRFEKFKGLVAAKSVSLVFSSYYLNNPSSAYGHSFLRINKTARTEGEGRGESDSTKYELLDNAVNFAAATFTDQPLLYAWFGMTGGFKGTYTVMPYYYKVREYNDFESRDLWSYDLNLSPEEIEMLVAHVWEMGPIYIPYLYFTQNCSFQILQMIEAAAPRYSIVDRLTFYVIPVDTIKAVHETPGLVQGVKYRPSARTLFYERASHLNNGEHDALEKILNPFLVGTKDVGLEQQALQGFSDEQRARVLDASLDYMDFRFPHELQDVKSEASKFKQTLLFARADVPGVSPEVKISPPATSQPHAGHDSARVGVGIGQERGSGKFVDFQYRFALHDALDPGAAYPEHAQVDFFSLRGSFFLEESKPELESLSVIRVLSLNSLTRYNRGRSWGVNMGLKRFRDANCERCLGGVMEGSYGFSKSLGALHGFGFVEPEFAFAPGFSGSNVRLGGGPAFGFLWDNAAGSVLPNFRAIAKCGYRAYLWALEREKVFASLEVRQTFGLKAAIGANIEVNHLERSNPMVQGAAQVFYYY